MAAKNLAHNLGFPSAEHPVIYDADGKLAANGLMKQRRGNARVHAATKPKNDFCFAYLGAYRFDGLVNVTAHRPVFAATADAMDKVAQHVAALRCVGDLRMELEGEHFARAIFHRSEFGVLADGDRLKAGRRARQFIAMRVPDLERFRQVGKKGTEAVFDA